jgi:hypothetical protein
MRCSGVRCYDEDDQARTDAKDDFPRRDLLLVIFTVSGCVMQSTYDAALQEGMTARAELARAKDEERVLARQVSDMELLNADVMREAEGAASALLQAKDDAETKTATGRTADREVATESGSGDQTTAGTTVRVDGRQGKCLGAARTH